MKSDVMKIVESIKVLTMWDLRTLIVAIEECYGIADPDSVARGLMADLESSESD